LAKAIDRVGKGNVPDAMCIAYAKKLVVVGYRVCVVDTISRETQIESWEANTEKLIKDISITQEPVAKTEQST